MAIAHVETMRDCGLIGAVVLLLVAWTWRPSAQRPVPWHDPSPHSVQVVTVDNNVGLEVLDWGGSGRPIVLLSGSGNTAHVFDDFAPKLASDYHVYGITRRGFGASSHPESGYTDQRLADDVLAVLDSLKIVKPVLVGHSMAGSEMTTLGVQHSDRLAGLVYLDAGDDPGDFSGKNPAYRTLFDKLPTMPPPPSSEADKKSFQAYRDRQMRISGFVFPESEWRNIFVSNPDGSVGPTRTANSVRRAIDEGSKKRDYSGINVPVLAFFAVDAINDGWSQYYHFRPKNAEERAALEEIHAADRSYLSRYEGTMRTGVPSARIVELPGADHYVFFTNETDVLREMRAFLTQLH